MVDDAPQKAPSAEDSKSVEALKEALGSDFEIKQRLGKGSMATVYLAKEKELGRLVAVKVLSSRRANDETARKRFEREAKAAASLTHPNVAQVFRMGRLRDETPYLVMRFVKGRTMEERLAAEGRLPAKIATEVLHDVASALAAAHAHGIVHRDVRPANVMWDEEKEQAVLTDFGIAAILATSGEESTRLTKTGQMVGDPRYLSPEQLRDEDLTELADMYAFGILGYELLTGEGPYEAKTNTQWITAHLSGEPKDIQRLRPDLDPGVASLLKRCMNREPNHRPSAASAASVLRPSQEPGSPMSFDADAASTLWEELMRRRFPQFVGSALLVGASVIAFTAEVVVGQFEADEILRPLSVPLALCGVAAATVITWYHGERGEQSSSTTERVLLAVIAAVWLASSAWILLS
jgi:serine/threonine protein kinase